MEEGGLSLDVDGVVEAGGEILDVDGVVEVDGAILDVDGVSLEAGGAIAGTLRVSAGVELVGWLVDDVTIRDVGFPVALLLSWLVDLILDISFWEFSTCTSLIVSTTACYE